MEPFKIVDVDGDSVEWERANKCPAMLTVESRASGDRATVLLDYQACVDMREWLTEAMDAHDEENR